MGNYFDMFWTRHCYGLYQKFEKSSNKGQKLTFVALKCFKCCLVFHKSQLKTALHCLNSNLKGAFRIGFLNIFKKWKHLFCPYCNSTFFYRLIYFGRLQTQRIFFFFFDLEQAWTIVSVEDAEYQNRTFSSQIDSIDSSDYWWQR